MLQSIRGYYELHEQLTDKVSGCFRFTVRIIPERCPDDSGMPVRIRRNTQLDGQQRTISICQYASGDFSIDHMGSDNLTQTEREQILNYPLMIYICEGWIATIDNREIEDYMAQHRHDTNCNEIWLYFQTVINW